MLAALLVSVFTSVACDEYISYHKDDGDIDNLQGRNILYEDFPGVCIKHSYDRDRKKIRISLEFLEWVYDHNWELS